MNNKKVKNILCFSHYDFDNIMRNNNWLNTPPNGVSCISICSFNAQNSLKHWFSDFVLSGLKMVRNFRVFNIDFDDVSPYWFKNHESECYDDALNLYNNGKIKQSNAYFSHVNISGSNEERVDIFHALDYEEAFNLTKWIDWRIKQDETIYIHCELGASRSQGVVRYIIDTYGEEYDIKLNPNNPNNTYNPHVTMMLKRAFRYNDINSVIDRHAWKT
jgi:hypothetical protein